MQKKPLKAAVLVACVFLVGFSILMYQRKDSCNFRREQKIVRGESLRGLIKDGATVTALVGYYSCHDPAINDVVLYRYGGSANQLIKIVKAVPGDRLRLQADKDGGGLIIVNENVLMTSDETPYHLNAAGMKILGLYTSENQGVIPPNAYLILGNIPSNSVDSSQFGLVSKNDFVGKVLLL